MVKKQRGFTLIELMVTITIIGILATVGAVIYSAAQKSARISKRVQDLEAFRTAIELFKSSTGFYPSVTSAGSFVCLESLTGANTLAPNYMPVVPKDPIQSGTTNCYQYTSNATGAIPAATEYKIRTNVPSTEMAFTDINQQPNLIDPAHDGNIGSGATACIVDPLIANVTNQGWAYYTTSATTCLY